MKFTLFSQPQNFENSETLEPSKYKKMTKFGPNKFLKRNDYEKSTKKEERKKEVNLPKPLPFFVLVQIWSFFNILRA